MNLNGLQKDENGENSVRLHYMPDAPARPVDNSALRKLVEQLERVAANMKGLRVGEQENSQAGQRRV